MYNPVNSIISVVVGVFMIIAWAPTIFFTEINNKGNRNELTKLKEIIYKPEFTITPGNLTGNFVENVSFHSDYSIQKSISDLGIDKNKYIYIYYDGVKETIKRDQNNKEYKDTTHLPSGIFLNSDVKFNTSLTLSDANLKYLAMKTKITQFKTTINNSTIIINFYGIINNAAVSKISGLKEYEKDIDMDVYDYELGNTLEEVRQGLIDRKSQSNTLQKWLGRLGTFLLLFIGLMALISPLRDIINAGVNIPVLNILLIPFQWLISLYNVASFFIALLLTIIMTIFVYTLVNFPLVSIIFGGMMVGLTLYFKK